MKVSSNDFAHLRMDEASLVIALKPTGPEVAYFGAPLADATAGDFAHLVDWPTPEAGFDELTPIAILAESSRGFPGPPGITGHRGDGSGSAPQMAAPSYEVGDDRLSATASDLAAGLAYELAIHADKSASVVTINAAVVNIAATTYELAGVVMTMPVPATATEALLLGGRWANEFQEERHDWHAGTLVAENRSGRTSFDRRPFIAVGSAGFAQETGQVWAAHLAWSGNATVRAEVYRDGRRAIQAGELLLSGEVMLDPGESYVAPALHLASSSRGLNGISAAFHRHIRNREVHPRKPRPVALNTWEAVYFDHDLDRLRALADRAAQIGVERFILDDGWFHGRRNDSAGLGDWWVDETVWPDGLSPLVDHVKGLGMEFGLWFEPEMVNPDSDLYRSHPEWALVNPEHEPPMFRNQLALDLANPEVGEYLFNSIDAILSAYDIAYVKWDTNRDLSAPEHNGRASVRRQVQAIYRLIARLKAAHPDLEVESSASGGARVDLGILQHTDRFWTSDCNDALDRQAIQRGVSYVFPPELMGSHIGPTTAHTTGRRHKLGFRAATALFGHMGIEWNILEAGEAEIGGLIEAIDLHKRLRPLLHTGEVYRIDHPNPVINAHAVIAHDGSHAVVSVAQVATSRTLAVGALRFGWLDSEARYEVKPISFGSSYGKAKSQPQWIRNGGLELSGIQLALAGVPLPVLLPESAFLIDITRVTG